MNIYRQLSRSVRPSNRRLRARGKAALFATFSVAALLAAPTDSRAVAYSWNVAGSGNWATGNFSPTGTPGASDSVLFNNPALNQNESIYLNGPQAAGTMTFGNTGTTTLLGGISGTPASNILTLGAGGITVNSGAGAVTLGSTATAATVPLILTAAQSFTNNSSNTLTINNGVSLVSTITAATKLTVAGTGNTVFAGIIANGGTTSGTAVGSLNLALTSSGTTTFSAANTFTGGTTISAGALVLTGTGSLASGITSTGTTTVISTASGSSIGGALAMTGGTLSLSGTLASTGAFTNSVVTEASTGSITGAVTASGSTLTLAGASTSFSLSSASTLTTNSGSAISGAVTLSGASIYNANASSTVGGAVTLGGASTYTAALGSTTNGAVTLNTGSVLTLNGALNNTLTVSGSSATISSTGVVTTTGAVAVTGSTASGAAVGGALDVSGVITASGTAGTVAVSSLFTGGNLVASTFTLQPAGTISTGNGTTFNGVTANVNGTIAAGATTVTGGVLNLDYTTTAGSHLADAGALSLNAATVNLIGGSHTEVVNNTNVGTASIFGTSTIARTSGASVLSLGTITRLSGSTLNIAADNLASTTTANSNGILTTNNVAYAVVGGTGGANWAVGAGTAGTATAITGLTSYAAFVGTGGVATANYTLTDSGTVTAAETFYTLKVNTSSAGQSLGIASGTALTLNGGGLLSVGADDYSITGGTLRSNAGTSDLALQQFGTGNLTIGSTIAAAGVLKNGAGTVTLNGTNTYTGVTYINQGTLAIGASAVTPLGATPVVYLQTGATLDISASSGVAINALNNGSAYGTGSVALGASTLTLGSASTTGSFLGSITGTGGVTKTGANTQSLLGTSNYSGVTTINAGILNVGVLANVNTASSIGAGSAGGSAADLVFNGGTLQYTGLLATSTNRLFTLGTSGGVIDSSSATGTSIVSFTGTGAVGFAGSGTHVLTLTGTNGGSGSNTGTLAGNNTFASLLSDGTGGATSLSKTGAGTWLVTNPSSSFTGGTTISAGRLIESAPGSLGTGLVTVANTTSQLVLFNAGTYTNNLSLAGVGPNAGSGSVSSSYGALVLNNGAVQAGTVTLTADTRVSATGVFPGSTLTGTISGQVTGGFGLDIGAGGAPTGGTITLSNTNNNYTGNTSISEGGTGSGSTATLLLGASGVIPNGAGKGDLVLNGLGTTGAVNFSLNGFSETINGLTSTGSATPKNIFNGNTTTASVLTLGDNDATATFVGTISNGTGSASLGITKIGAGTQTLSGSNSYTGPTIVQAGTLASAGTSATVFGANNVTVFSGATLNLSGGTATYTVNALAGDATTTGSIVLGANTLSVGNSLTTVPTTFAGAISGTGGLTKTGTSTQILSGTNTYTGTTTLTAGILNVSSAGALNGTPLITFGGGTLQYGAGVTTDLSSKFSNAASQVYNIDTNGSDVAYAANLTSSAGTLTKLGAGNLTLSGANTYSGTTTLTGGGTLTLNYATNNSTHLSDTSALVLAGGTLALSGGTHTEVVSATTLNAGTTIVTRPSGGATLTLNTITKAAGGALSFTAPSLATAANTITNGILGAGYTVGTVGSMDWATNTGANTAITAYTAYTTTVPATTGAAAANYSFTGNQSFTSAAYTANTLRINTSGSGQSLSLAAANVTSLTAGGILFVGADDYSITGGTLRHTTANGELIFSQWGTGKLTVGSLITANGTNAFTKTGTGTLALTNANNYTGVTYVTQGNLQLANTVGTTTASATGTGAVTLNGGAATTLSGTGNANGLVTATNGSRIAPGINTSGTNTNFGNAGTLVLGTNNNATPVASGLTLTNANLDFDLASSAAGASDRIATNGTLTLGTVNFTFNELTPGTLDTSASYTLISGATTLSSANVLLTGTVTQGDFTPTFAFSGNNLTVSFAATVPEPGTWAAGGLMVLTAGYMVRRRFQSKAA